jgi:hypothetical protein
MVSDLHYLQISQTGEQEQSASCLAADHDPLVLLVRQGDGFSSNYPY